MDPLPLLYDPLPFICIGVVLAKFKRLKGLFQDVSGIIKGIMPSVRYLSSKSFYMMLSYRATIVSEQ